MSGLPASNIHRMKQTRRKCKTRESRETRIMIGLRFKYQLADAGLSIAEAAKLLHVTERTVRYWISGKVSVPYAAYKLVRVLRYFELPGDQWKGWHFAAGKLWSRCVVDAGAALRARGTGWVRSAEE